MLRWRLEPSRHSTLWAHGYVKKSFKVLSRQISKKVLEINEVDHEDDDGEAADSEDNAEVNDD